MNAWADWDHIVKVDPDKTLPDGETFEDVCATGTDAIAVGGTTGMTEEKMTEYVEGCIEGARAYDVPVFIEPSSAGVVVHPDGLDGYLVPIVFNAGDIAWMTGAHKEWVRIDRDIDWAHTHTEAYIVLNPDASVATYTQADCDLDPDDVAAYAEVAERMLDVLDDFDRTLDAAGDVDPGFLKGVELVHDKLARVLADFGLTRIDEAGIAFDPTRHEAVQQVEATEERDEPVVTQVLRPGYELGGRTLRAAMVTVEQ